MRLCNCELRKEGKFIAPIVGAASAQRRREKATGREYPELQRDGPSLLISPSWVCASRRRCETVQCKSSRHSPPGFSGRFSCNGPQGTNAFAASPVTGTVQSGNCSTADYDRIQWCIVRGGKHFGHYKNCLQYNEAKYLRFHRPHKSQRPTLTTIADRPDISSERTHDIDKAIAVSW
jgi:hypothetical protein